MEQDIPKTQNTMEDGVTEIPNMFPPLNQISQDESKREDAKEKEEGFVSTEKVEKIKEEGKDSSGGGGVISNLISTFMTPSSPRTEKDTTQDESGNEVLEKKEEVDNNDGEKGLISNLVSNFFHKRESEEVVVEKEEEEIKVDEKIKRLKTENEANGGNGGGGFIHDIVSHLPGKKNKKSKTKGSFCKILY